MNDPQILYQIPDSGPPISRARLATVLWLVVETMIFAGMLSAFVITRKAAHEWPPTYENARAEPIRPPRVELLVPTVNAGVLISAFVVALMAQRAARKREAVRCRLRLTTVAVLGSIFVGLVAWEFFHEAGRGVTIRAGSYGAYWSILTAAHALHVLAGVIWLFIALRVRVTSLPLVAIDAQRVEHLGIYWGFVTIVWIVLLVLLHIL
jgi:heme/copper-type cytochrome/quinol oxidase subunit 3